MKIKHYEDRFIQSIAVFFVLTMLSILYFVKLIPMESYHFLLIAIISLTYEGYNLSKEANDNKFLFSSEVWFLSLVISIVILPLSSQYFGEISTLSEIPNAIAIFVLGLSFLSNGVHIYKYNMRYHNKDKHTIDKEKVIEELNYIKMLYKNDTIRNKIDELEDIIKNN